MNRAPTPRRQALQPEKLLGISNELFGLKGGLIVMAPLKELIFVPEFSTHGYIPLLNGSADVLVGI